MNKQSPVLTSTLWDSGRLSVISPMIIDMAFDMKEEHDKDFNFHILPSKDSVSLFKMAVVVKS